jgi:hypothetical protein
MNETGVFETPVYDGCELSVRKQRVIEAGSYLGAVSAIVTGYATSYLMTAVEMVDRRMGQNVIPDRLSVLTGIGALAVGGMGSAVLRLLNSRR